MAILTVGTSGQQFSTIEAAVTAASPGDTIQVQAGTYTDDFLGIYKNLTLQAVGGMVQMVETQDPPNGKAMIDEGGSGVSVNISGFDVSGVAVGDDNGAAIRYEGGNLSLSDVYFHNNQEGLLGAADPNGTISVDHSEFAFNGDGSGFTHNIYVGRIASLVITNSYFHDANEGHEIKSRAANTTITNDRIFDNNGTASYSIDLPNGGNATIQNDVIEQGPFSDNPNIIAYGEEGVSNPGTNVVIANNVIVNDLASSNAQVILNRSPTPLTFTDNQVYGTTRLVNGPLNASGTVFLTTRPVLDTSSIAQPSSGPVPPSVPGTTVIGSGSDTVALAMSEDAWNGDARFTVSVDGQQIGGVQTVVASRALGQSQEFDVRGNFGAGQHNVTVNFLNDAYGGTPATDRNLYLTSASYDGVAATGSLALFRNGPQSLVVDSAPVSSVPATVTVGSGADTLDLKVNEDAWNGDAQFTVSVDGQQIGGTLTAQASHAAGAAQDFLVDGNFSAGQHTVTVNFLNDAYGGTPATDRNLYVTGATIDGQSVSGSSLALYRTGPESFTFQGAAAVTASTISSQLNGTAGGMAFIGGSTSGQAEGTAVASASGSASPSVGSEAHPGQAPGNVTFSDLAANSTSGLLPSVDPSGGARGSLTAGDQVSGGSILSLPHISAPADSAAPTNLFG
jgi:Ca-dependent carbohydrate-binding module xylan-binding